MCGIWFSLGIKVEEDVMASLAHRGPDGAGWRVFSTAGGPLALGHRRLAIIDTSPAAAQPMSDPEGRFWLSYNGEIYNYLELRRELENSGHRFRTQSDSEVLLAAYMAWGVDCLNRLIGMFAFALYDVGAGKVILARDPFGIKPLFYSVLPQGVAAASEIKALLVLPDVDRKVDPQRLFSYLRHGRLDHGQGTMYSAIRQVPAGHCALIEIGTGRGFSVTGYWRPRATGACRLSHAEAAERLRELFLESIRIHLRSDVPLGILLSGGIDSSSILSAVRKILGPDAPLPAFTYAAEDAAIDEESWSSTAARAAGATHHVIRIPSGHICNEIDDVIAHQDEPFASTSVYAQYRVFAAVRDAGLKLVLDGQGADEMLAGYPTYLSDRLISLISRGRFDKAMMLLLRARQSGRARAALRTGAAFLPPALDALGRRLLGEPPVPAWLDRGWAESADAATLEMVPRSGNALHRRLLSTMSESSLPALLRYEDRNAMSWSVESRLPFLTVPMADFVLSLPEEQLIDGSGVTKAVFRAAMRGIVPDEVLDRRDKIGFATPQHRWMKELRPWLLALFSSSAAREFAPLSPRALRQIQSRLSVGEVPAFNWLWRCANAIRWIDLKGARL